jgi:hypothetical protein
MTANDIGHVVDAPRIVSFAAASLFMALDVFKV